MITAGIRSGLRKIGIERKVLENLEESLRNDLPLRVLILGGPTGSGKSRIALQIGRVVPSEIVNADSRQVYRELAIGTCRPSEADVSEMRHHLYGFLSPDRTFSAAEYEKMAVRVLTDISHRQRWAIVVGGTGFYIRSLLRGVWPAPPKDPALRERLRNIGRRKGNRSLHKLLSRVDPEAAESISVNDTYRVVRALEIFYLSGIRRSHLPRQQEERFPALKFYVHPDRAKLKDRIIHRTDAMFRSGWLDEVAALIQKYPDFESFPSARSLGYPDIVRHIRGEMDLDTCKQSVVRQTLQYAKRQLTWFRNQDGFTPIAGEEELHKIINSVIQWRGFDENREGL